MAVRRESKELQPIYRTPLFRSDERAASHWQVAQELSDHQLTWRRGAVDTALYKGELPRLKMYVLRYGAEVEVRPRPFQDFALVHMSLRGATEIESDGHRVGVAEGRAVVVAPRRDIRLRWLPGTEQLILKVPNEVIAEARSETGSTAELAPVSLLPSALTPQWSSLMRTVLSVPRLQSGTGMDAGWVAGFERTVAHFVLAHQQPARPIPVSREIASRPQDADGIAAAPDLQRLHAMRRHMTEHLGSPLALQELAQAAGVSVRTLHDLCLRHWGAPPMRMLRNLRLDAARERLLHETEPNVTRIAMDCGFGHAGRFSAYYEERFHELPRETAYRGR